MVDGELLGNLFVILANRYFPSLLLQLSDICHFKTASGYFQHSLVWSCVEDGVWSCFQKGNRV